MDVLVVSQFFTPEMGAPAARFHDFGRLLVERGHRVTVLTGFPNSPSGVVPPAYRRRLAQRENVDGIDVCRSWLYASPRLSAVTKSLGFATFAGTASLAALLRRLRADVVVATSPPPTVAIAGILAARRRRAPLVFDVRDIWPEAIALSGRVKSGLLVRGLEHVERRAYRESAAVTVVTEGKRERLIEKGVPAERIHVIPNGVELSRFDRSQAVEGLLREHGVEPGRFVVLYAGVFNPPQGLDVLLDAAAQIRASEGEAARRVQFVLVGAGSERERLERRRASEGLEGMVAMLPEQPRERVPSLLAAAGAVAVTLRPRRDTHTVPSKLYEAMASGRPVLVSADGAPAGIVRESEAGLATPASDAAALASAVLRLADDAALCRKLGKAGEAWAARFDRRRIVERFERVLLDVAEAGRQGGRGFGAPRGTAQ